MNLFTKKTDPASEPAVQDDPEIGATSAPPASPFPAFGTPKADEPAPAFGAVTDWSAAPAGTLDYDALAAEFSFADAAVPTDETVTETAAPSAAPTFGSFSAAPSWGTQAAAEPTAEPVAADPVDPVDEPSVEPQPEPEDAAPAASATGWAPGAWTPEKWKPEQHSAPTSESIIDTAVAEPTLAPAPDFILQAEPAAVEPVTEVPVAEEAADETPVVATPAEPIPAPAVAPSFIVPAVVTEQPTLADRDAIAETYGRITHGDDEARRIASSDAPADIAAVEKWVAVADDLYGLGSGHRSAHLSTTPTPETTVTNHSDDLFAAAPKHAGRDDLIVLISSSIGGPARLDIDHPEEIGNTADQILAAGYELRADVLGEAYDAIVAAALAAAAADRDEQDGLIRASEIIRELTRA
ncbi:hypothetical protein [Leifsonia sp. Leaf264]|uniref:hypothetical protein n=1 Tax=Leifsonia sp. Leaf264 TaxID=1736314 RepID=UPI0006F4EA48|nr:hypothetical protein [Leifsonia sp. Leaf264]KQO98257.1 hypothetical protein ASF30_09355 [Leifsonia sp. Leaf264]